MRFVAADLGGSWARLLLGETTATGWHALRREAFPAHEFPDFAAALEAFVHIGDQPATACLALAGPVEGESARMTNLPWTLSAPELAARFGFARVQLVNDFAAQAHGLPGLGADGLCTLQAGRPEAAGPRLLLGAGTGCGVALLVQSAAGPLAMPSEGGHADFAPADAQQIALLKSLRAVHPRVSVEHLLSGRGLERVYRFVCELPASAKRPLTAPDLHAAADRGEPAARAALQLFARIYASAAGNLALATLPHGGVYLSGGIAPKILPYLQDEECLEAFRDKPPMRALLGSLPLHVVRDEFLGLHGAATLAARLAPDHP